MIYLNACNFVLWQLLGRFGTIEEAGQLCLFLAAEGTFCTGIDINLSGGAELDYGRKTRKYQQNGHDIVNGDGVVNND